MLRVSRKCSALPGGNEEKLVTIFSIEERLSEGQVLVAGGDPSDQAIDLGSPGTVRLAPVPLTRGIGKGQPIVIDVAVRSLTFTPTLTVSLQVDSDEFFGSPRTVAVAPTISAVGKVRLDFIPEGTSERYLRAFYTLGGVGTMTIDAGVVLASPTDQLVAGVLR